MYWCRCMSPVPNCPVGLMPTPLGRVAFSLSTVVGCIRWRAERQGTQVQYITCDFSKTQYMHFLLFYLFSYDYGKHVCWVRIHIEKLVTFSESTPSYLTIFVDFCFFQVYTSICDKWGLEGKKLINDYLCLILNDSTNYHLLFYYI